jgi:hypothetical protein
MIRGFLPDGKTRSKQVSRACSTTTALLMVALLHARDQFRLERRARRSPPGITLMLPLLDALQQGRSLGFI